MTDVLLVYWQDLWSVAALQFRSVCIIVLGCVLVCVWVCMGGGGCFPSQPLPQAVSQSGELLSKPRIIGCWDWIYRKITYGSFCNCRAKSIDQSYKWTTMVWKTTANSNPSLCLSITFKVELPFEIRYYMKNATEYDNNLLLLFLMPSNRVLIISCELFTILFP